MTLLPGARDLGLTTRWRYRFVRHGFTADPTPGAVYVDVGGRLAPGVLDHHDGGSLHTCTASLVLHQGHNVYNHLLAPWLDLHRAGQVRPGTTWEPTIVTHTDPDWDGVVTTMLIEALVDTGGLPSEAEALVAYASQVDQGRYRLDFLRETTWFAPHLLFLAHVSQPRERPGAPLEPEERWTLQLRWGVELLKTHLERVGKARRSSGLGAVRTPEDLLPDSPGTLWWRTDPEYRDLEGVLRRDLASFDEDRRAASIEDIEFPAADGGSSIRVRTFVAGTPMQSLLAKYWVRASGHPAFVCPFPAAPGSKTASERYSRVILSLDPNWVAADGRRPTMRGLGFALETAEVEARGRQPGGDRRSGAPRFPGGYCRNSDPWYDGRGHDYTIVDSPSKAGGGTVLPYARILDVLRSPYWKVPLVEASAAIVWAPVGSPTGSTLDRFLAGSSPEPRPVDPDLGRGLAKSLQRLYRAQGARPGILETSASVSAPQLEALGLGLGPGLNLELTDRLYPVAAAGIERVTLARLSLAEGPAFLEDFVSGVVTTSSVLVSGAPPPFLVVEVVLGANFSGEAHLRSQLARMAEAEGGPEPRRLSGDLHLVGPRVLVLLRTEASGERADSTSVRELIEFGIYTAFVHAALSHYSTRLADLAMHQVTPIFGLGSTSLRIDFLRFQVSYFHVNPADTPAGRTAVRAMWRGLRIQEEYTQMQAELDRLAEIEAAKRQLIVQIGLPILSVLGIVSVGKSLLDEVWNTTGLLVGLGVCAVVACAWAIAWWRRRLLSRVRQDRRR